MYIVRNDIIPFKGFKIINLCGVLFVRNDAELSDVDINHEKIHSEQMLEMLIIFYYLWYILEWLFRFLFTKDRFSKKAYKNMSFEQEAYDNQEDLNYIEWRRKAYAWIKYLK